MMLEETSPGFKKVDWWVKFYSYITIAAVLYGIAAAHVPAIIGIPWSSCEFCNCKLYCVLVFHLYEVPLVTFNAYFAWYGLKRFSSVTIHNYSSLLTFAIISNLAFFTFESVLLLDSVKNSAPAWESIGLSSVATILITGSGLGLYVKQRIVSLLYQTNQN
jgi:hypothetical protein